jgi:single-strand DNA-binding protein
MINRIILVGRLTADPEVRQTSNGIPVATLRIAVQRQYRGQDGERQTDFINVVAWRKTAELCRDYLRKGRLVGVDGSLQSRSYEDRDGNRRTAYEVQADSVQFLEPRSAGGAASEGVPPPSDHEVPGGYASDPGPEPMGADGAAMDDDIPF